MRSLFCLALMCVMFASMTQAASKKPIFDPFNVFCGEENCYDILGIEREASSSEVRKAYRELAKTVHPDKVHPDKRINVTEQFRVIKQAHAVLMGNESRPNFDFYLDHPRSYFKATGKHAWRSLPKMPPIVAAILSMLVFSVFLHFIQINRHERAAATLKDQVKAGLGPTKGGTKLSADLNSNAVRLYEAYCKTNGIKIIGNINSTAAKEKMENDPKYDAICTEVIKEIKDWGVYAKPQVSELFIIKAFTVYPFSFLKWAKTYYRRNHSGNPLTADDKEEMARDAIGTETWTNLSSQERSYAIESKLWESEAYDSWLIKREGTQEVTKRQQKIQKKNAKFGRVNMGPDPSMLRDLTE